MPDIRAANKQVISRENKITKINDENAKKIVYVKPSDQFHINTTATKNNSKKK